MMKIYKTLLVLLIVCSSVSLQSYAQDKLQLDSLAYALVNTMLATEIKDLSPDLDSLETISMRQKFGDSVRLFYRYLEENVILDKRLKYEKVPVTAIYYRVLKNFYWNLEKKKDTIPRDLKIKLEDSVNYQMENCVEEKWDRGRLILNDSYILTPSLSEESRNARSVPLKYDFRTGKPIPWKRTDPEYEGWVKSNVYKIGWRISYPAFFQYENILYALITIQYNTIPIARIATIGYLYKWEEQEWKKVYQDRDSI